MLTRVRRAAPVRSSHLSYEQLEALVDNRLPAAERSNADTHLAHCTVCNRELAQLRSVAADLSGPLTARERPPVPALPVWRRLADWLGAPQAMAGAAALTVAVIAGVLIAPWGAGPSGDAGSNASAQIGREGGPATGLALKRGEFDPRALDVIRAQGGTAAAAIERGDYPAAAAALRVRADQSDPSARAALGWLYLNGLGVARDPQAAQQWLMKAVGGIAGDSSDQSVASRRAAAVSAHNLGVIHERGLIGAADAAEAERWYQRAAEIAVSLKP